MTHHPETGHIINLASFDNLIKSAESLGSRYNPSNDTLTIDSLKLLHKKCTEAFNEWSSAYLAWKRAVGDRKHEFNPLAKMATRVINSASITGIDSRMLDNGRSFIRLLRGKRLKPKRTKEQVEEDKLNGKEHKEISVSHLGYDMRIDHFRNLILFLKNIKNYSPNEKELTVETLSIYLQKLEESNSNVMHAYSALYRARAKRDQMLYGPCNGLTDTAQLVKSYIKAVYGPASEQFRNISRIYFRKRELKFSVNESLSAVS
ncbi:MAG TPA: hypothetical protein VK155_11545 [Bacteroidales bacterium]|nr:hypothetical protein [Bacteroidales bacterium]